MTDHQTTGLGMWFIYFYNFCENTLSIILNLTVSGDLNLYIFNKIDLNECLNNPEKFCRVTLGTSLVVIRFYVEYLYYL